MNQPWILKYLPKSSNEVVGQDNIVIRLKDYISSYKQQKKKAVLAFGPVGCGKTSAVYAVAEESNLEIVELNASDTRNASGIIEKIGQATNQMSLFSQGKVILIDEIDGLSGTKDRGGLQAVIKLMEKSSFPIIMVCENPYDQKFSSLRRKCELLQFNALTPADITNKLKQICEKENIQYEEDALKSLARRNDGDLRGTINDLQSLSSNGKFDKACLEELGDRNKTESILNALVKIFKGSQPEIALTAFDNVNEDLDKCTLWIDENLPKEYQSLSLTRAYDMLSKADVFKGRIRRWQHWRFLTYVNALTTAGIATAKDEKNKEFIKYAPTMRILKIWQANMKYNKRKNIALKIAEKTHTSSKVVLKDTLPYIQSIFKNNKEQAQKMTDFFELDKDEVGWLKK